MMQYYIYFLWAHIFCVFLSGGYFLTRTLNSLAQKEWPHTKKARRISYTIDTLLLTFALILVFILPKSTFANGWLGAKLFLVVSYILCGFGAMNQKNPIMIRKIFLGFGIICFTWIIGIALNHDARGFLLNLQNI